MTSSATIVGLLVGGGMTVRLSVKVRVHHFFPSPLFLSFPQHQREQRAAMLAITSSSVMTVLRRPPCREYSPPTHCEEYTLTTPTTGRFFAVFNLCLSVCYYRHHHIHPLPITDKIPSIHPPSIVTICTVDKS